VAIKMLKGKIFYDAVWERLTALKSYKLISAEKNEIKLTQRGIEFLKHDDKAYYLGKILLMDKYKRTKHPEIFKTCFEEFVNLTSNDRKLLKKVLLMGYEIDYEDIKEKDLNVWKKFENNIAAKLRHKNIKVDRNAIRAVCGRSLRNIIVGTQAPMDIPLPALKKILEELQTLTKVLSSEKSLTKNVDEKSLTIQNMLELQVEEMIRRNFNSLFPELKIIDNNQHYYTIDGNYIDILAKSKKTGEYAIIELKRDRSPSRALIQLLDYMNQVMKEFKTKKVKGILVCNQVDKRTKSALNALRNKLKNPNEISIIEFNLKMKINKV